MRAERKRSRVRTAVRAFAFLGKSYHALSRQDAARWADLGTYRA
jgi:hypothetical protein